MLVERRNALVLGLHDDEAGRHQSGGCDHSLQRVGQQGAAEAPAVQVGVEREPGEQHR